MEIKEGMYVRTIQDSIAKVEDVDRNMIITDKRSPDDENSYNFLRVAFFKKDIKKASYRLIDLVEVGDLVNGMIVTEINKQFADKGKEFIMIFRENEEALFQEDIKTILTHEQIEQNSYRV